MASLAPRWIDPNRLSDRLRLNTAAADRFWAVLNSCTDPQNTPTCVVLVSIQNAHRTENLFGEPCYDIQQNSCMITWCAGPLGAIQRHPAGDVCLWNWEVFERLRRNTVRRRSVLDLPLQHLRAQLAAAQLHPSNRWVRPVAMNSVQSSSNGFCNLPIFDDRKILPAGVSQT